MRSAGGVEVDSKEVLIGLEIHVQMTSLKTKLFCGCSSDYRGKPPNTNVCPVCLGLPGALPVVNIKAIEKAVQVALALHMKISDRVEWVRKHYFYPDLPKNYQITQYDGRGTKSIASNGYLEYNCGNNTHRARIRRINIEEDPGRIVYPTGSMTTSRYVLVDYNRSGIALLEIVTEPDFSDEITVVSFLRKLRTLLEHLDVADFSLEGSMRVDVNISVGGGSRVEVKNLGSLYDIENAIRFEITRQRSLIEKGIPQSMETRHWDPQRKVTVPVRTKETAADYRYMLDPNLPPITLLESYILELRRRLPELPDQKLKRYVEEHGLTRYQASVLIGSRKLSDYYDKVIELSGVNPRKVASYIINDLLGWIEAEDPVRLWHVFPPNRVASVLRELDEGRITIKAAKEVIPYMARGEDPLKIIEEKGWLAPIRDEKTLIKLFREVVSENPKILEDVKRNKRAIQYIIGSILKKSGGRADPTLVSKIVVRELRSMGILD